MLIIFDFLEVIIVTWTDTLRPETLDMTSEELGEMFQGAENFPLKSMGAKRRVWRAQTRSEDPVSGNLKLK